MTDLFLHKDNRETLIKKILNNEAVIDEKFFKKQLLTRKCNNRQMSVIRELNYILNAFPIESIKLFDKYEEQLNSVYNNYFTSGQGNYKESLRYTMNKFYDPYWDLDDDEHSRMIARDLEKRMP